MPDSTSPQDCNAVPCQQVPLAARRAGYLFRMWSQDPGLTLRKGVALIGTTLIGIDFAGRYSVRDQLRLLYLVLGFALLLGIVAQLFFPR